VSKIIKYKSLYTSSGPITISTTMQVSDAMQTVGLFFGVHLLEINGCDLVDPTSTHDF
jgi:hypothetical protein